LVAESNLVLMILHIPLWLCLWGWNKCWPLIVQTKSKHLIFLIIPTRIRSWNVFC
jgi:hypothetical protein